MGIRASVTPHPTPPQPSCLESSSERLNGAEAGFFFSFHLQKDPTEVGGADQLTVANNPPSRMDLILLAHVLGTALKMEGGGWFQQQHLHVFQRVISFTVILCPPCHESQEAVTCFYCFY